LLGGKIIPCRHKKNGDFFVETADGFGEFKAIDPGHHDVGYHKVEYGAVHGIVCFGGAEAAGGAVAAGIQKGADRAVQISVVFYDQNMKHGKASVSLCGNCTAIYNSIA